jgi:glycosyltransferase involved in cell wall biosynthesis
MLHLGKQLLAPDAQILWQPHAQLATIRRLRTHRDEVVFISGPPFSQFLLGPTVRLFENVKLVLDYRDEWCTYRAQYEMMGGLARSVGDVLEPTLLRRAHAVTVATPAFRANLLERFDFLKPGQVIVIPNGYDPNDFPESLPEPRSDTLTITYAGTVYRLTTLKYFVEAIRLLHRRSPTIFL